MTQPDVQSFAVLLDATGQLLDHTDLPVPVLTDLEPHLPHVLHNAEGAVLLPSGRWQYQSQVTVGRNRWVRFHLQRQGTSLAVAARTVCWRP